MDLGFSIDLRDHEGDIYDECILIHIGKSTIIRFESYAELLAFTDKFKVMLNEIEDNLPPERRSRIGNIPISYEDLKDSVASEAKSLMRNFNDTSVVRHIAEVLLKLTA